MALRSLSAFVPYPFNEFCGYGNYTKVTRIVNPTQVAALEQGELTFSIIEQNATMLQHAIELLGDENEKKIFNKLYEGPTRICAPHHLYDYATVDRTRFNTDEADELTADPFKKIQDAFFTGFTPMGENLDDAMFAFIAEMSLGTATDEYGLPLLPEGPDLDDSSLIVNAARNNSSRGDFASTKARTKHETYPEDIKTAQRILAMLTKGDYCVPYVPSTTTTKQENLKYDKGIRFIAIEHASANYIAQILIGHYIDTKVGCSFNVSMNGLTPQYGVLPHIFDRMLRNQLPGWCINYLEQVFMKASQDGNLTSAIDDINDMVIMVVSDFKNYEYNHNPMVKLFSHVIMIMYFVPDLPVAKALAYWLESHLFVHMLLGAVDENRAALITARAGTVISGTLNTLYGNGIIQKFMHFMPLSRAIKDNPRSKSLDYYILWVLLSIMMGDDFGSLLNPIALPHVLQHSWYLSTVLYQHLKYEYKQFISKPTNLGFNSNAGDFLKTCAHYDITLKKIIYYKPTDQFMLRLLAYNSADILSTRLLASYSSMGLQTAGNPFMYAMLKKMYDNAFKQLQLNNMIHQVETPRTRGLAQLVAGVGGTYLANYANEDNYTKQEMKFLPDPLSYDRTAVLEFPSYERVITAAADNAAVLSSLKFNNHCYALFGINGVTCAFYS